MRHIISDPQWIGLVLAYSDVNTSAEAAQIYAMAKTTLDRWRSDHKPGDGSEIDKYRQQYKEAFIGAATKAWQRQSEMFIARADAVRLKLMERVLELAETCDNVRDAAGAFKIIVDSHLAERIYDRLRNKGAGDDQEGTDSLDWVAAAKAFRPGSSEPS